ncbi:MAG: phosphosulfolactate synthase [Chitinophagales bacterium]|nr:phosphosulfolactate synthase [Chitinophagales bacterium]
MNFKLNNLPKRTVKPREVGLTMVMDKNLSLREIDDFLTVNLPYVDMVKLGFGTAYVLPNLREKLEKYKSAGLATYFGGTLFEAFIARDQFYDYMELIQKYEMPLVEVSDGSLEMEHKVKLDYIAEISKVTKVISEVGSKDNEHIIPPYKWVKLMKDELEAGSWKVIAEARESGTTGIYMEGGSPRLGLVDEILHEIPQENIIWEAPIKSQQVYFIKKLGPNVNLGNIAPSDVIPLETLRLGLRGDTFHHFLDENVLKEFQLK